MLQLFSRHDFERAVREHQAERHARGFTCWGQFVAMLFCQLGRAQWLREICGGLAASEGKLRHLGLPSAPSRSTLAYANEHRPWQLYRSVFYQLLDRCRAVAGSHGFRFKNKLLSLDASLIALCASIFDWAQYRRTKGSVKLHLLLDRQGLLPSYAFITEGRVHESRIARALRFEPGTIGVIDWTKAHQNKLAALQSVGLNDDGKGNVKAPKNVMASLAQENAPLVDEGLKYLTMAVNERPNYDDAMQYLNLIYRNKADVDYGNQQAVDQDLAMAEDWTHKAMDMRKLNEEKKNAGPGGITMDSSGQMH